MEGVPIGVNQGAAEAAHTAPRRFDDMNVQGPAPKMRAGSAEGNRTQGNRVLGDGATCAADSSGSVAPPSITRAASFGGS